MIQVHLIILWLGSLELGLWIGLVLGSGLGLGIMRFESLYVSHSTEQWHPRLPELGKRSYNCNSEKKHVEQRKQSASPFTQELHSIDFVAH